MNLKKVIISGTGCALADYLYNGISFNSSVFRKFMSKKPGDMGLNPGKLVFAEELEKYAGCSFTEILTEIVGDKLPDCFNVGGPSIVSLIHVSQMLDNDAYVIKYFGQAGKDETARKIFDIINITPLNINNYKTNNSNVTPFTVVFSDPDFENGQGERTFVNTIGAAAEYLPKYLTREFFNSHIVCFGGTALVPQIHDSLGELLFNAKVNHCITVVNTVFDFRNELCNPGKPWPLGGNDLVYRFIDVLIMDFEEALKISGQKTIGSSVDFFISSKVSSFIITNGASDVLIWSNGSFFKKTDLTKLPVSRKVTNRLKLNVKLKGDTTGCGDNFTGGIIASIAWQQKIKKNGQFDLIESTSWGIASGGFTCYVIGGTYIEKFPGEKFLKVQKIQTDYLKQIALRIEIERKKKIVIFGAGKIGRSFIGQLFSMGGYEVVFIDINNSLIDELNIKGKYKVVLISNNTEEVIWINNVRGIYAGEKRKIIQEIETAEIIAVSVGLSAHAKIFPVISKGLMRRYKRDNSLALDIIIAENMRNADSYFYAELKKLLPGYYPLHMLVGIIETSIGKMVPIMRKSDIQEDPLQIFSEPYNTLILNKKGFKNQIPPVKGLDPKDNIKAWVDRKLFIHNLGHSSAAYIGYLRNPQLMYLYDALDIPDVYEATRAAMLQSADILLKKYPNEFISDALTDHIDDLLLRFKNKTLGDTIFRAGCDLKRKLGPEDRLSGAIKEAINLNLPYDRILYALVCGCYFRARDENGNMLSEDVEFMNLYQDDIIFILKAICGFNESKTSKLVLEVEVINNRVKNYHKKSGLNTL